MVDFEKRRKGFFVITTGLRNFVTILISNLSSVDAILPLNKSNSKLQPVRLILTN